MPSQIPAIRKNPDVAIRAQWLLDSTVGERMDAGLDAEDVIADLLAEIHRIRPYMADLARQWIEEHQAEALEALVAAGRLGRAFLTPESRYALPGDAGWRLLTVEQARDFMPELLTEIWLRADTLPCLLGEEGAGDE